MQEDDWESWSCIVRSTVLTSKHPLSPREIERDIKTIEGENVPYRKLGFSSFEDMLKKISGLKITQSNGQVLVQSIATEKTAHLQEMIKRQKSSKKKPRALPHRFNRYNSTQNRFQTSNKSFPRRNNFTPPYSPSVQKKFSYSKPEQHSAYNPPQQKTANNVQPIKRISPPPPLVNKSKLNTIETKPQTQTKSSNSIQSRLNAKPQGSSVPGNLGSAPLSSIQSRLGNKSTAPKQENLVPMPLQSPAPKNNVNKLEQRLQAARCLEENVDPCTRLKKYAQNRGLPPPSYKNVQKGPFTYSSVEINNRKFNTYPQETKTIEEANKLAAEMALAKLTEEKTLLTVTKDRNKIVERIIKIVNDHPNGLFESSVVDTYASTYNEGLPEDWVKIVEKKINVEIGVNNSTILSPPSEKIQNGVCPSQLLVTEPESIKINQMGDFWMRILFVYSTTDVWGVINDENYYDQLYDLSEEMAIFYNSESSNEVSVKTGRYYAVLDADVWHRVRCIKEDSDNQKATIMFIDRGDQDEFPLSSFRALDSKFCQLPAQAVNISIKGFELFEDCDEAQEILYDLIYDKDVYVVNRSTSPGIIDVQLYAEIDGKEVSISELLKNQLLPKIADPTKLVDLGRPMQKVFISHVNQNEIFVQVESKGLKYLGDYIAELTKEFLNNAYFKIQPVYKFDASKMYVTKYNDEWCRVKITSIENENLAEVKFIDLGEVLRVHRSSLVLLEDLSELLADYPPQAVKVSLHKISPLMFDENMAAQLRKLAPKNQIFLMKVVDNRPEMGLVVSMFQRTENNLLASLNDTLALTQEFSKDDNNNAKPRMRNDRSVQKTTRSEIPLKSPDIPGIDKFFDVTVVMAAHPGNFTVQPRDTAQELEELMMELSEICNSYRGPAIKPSCLKVGNMCAAKYDDGRWYRAYVSKIITASTYAVYFVDYGDYKAVSLEQLQPLQEKFKKLPYQAIKAKLHNVVSKSKDWTVKDSVRFNELVVNKSFVSCIKSCDKDDSAQSSGDIVLGLQLWDTTDPEVDVNIVDILVNENRAERKN